MDYYFNLKVSVLEGLEGLGKAEGWDNFDSSNNMYYVSEWFLINDLTEKRLKKI